VAGSGRSIGHGSGPSRGRSRGPSGYDNDFGVSERHIEIRRGDLAKIGRGRPRAGGVHLRRLDCDGARGWERGRSDVRAWGRRTFDLLIGADGLHTITRRLVFGPEESFLRFLGGYLAVFTVPQLSPP
jgi:2-polyprenyl-6-methoxyphenol hydroxylase-like FAD-dependent oxidoreductase